MQEPICQTSVCSVLNFRTENRGLFRHLVRPCCFGLPFDRHPSVRSLCSDSGCQHAQCHGVLLSTSQLSALLFIRSADAPEGPRSINPMNEVNMIGFKRCSVEVSLAGVEITKNICFNP